MKAIQSFNPLILLLCTIACANNNHNATVKSQEAKNTIAITPAPAIDTFKGGKIVSPVSCEADATQSYALYIPAKNSQESLPVIYFFDPHGNGTLPLAKYKPLAELFGFILVGSNNSRNGNDLAATENICSNLFSDSQKKLKIDNKRIYTCGFSGGAKVATYAALKHQEVKGVIANGAALPDITEAGNFQFSFTAIAGEGDMNMTDLVAINNDLDKTQARHRVIFFEGKHEWATESAMRIAFAGLQLDAMYKKEIPVDDIFISNFIDDSKKRIADELKTNNYLKAEADCKLAAGLLEGLTNSTNWFKEKDKSIKNNSAYQKQSQVRQNLFVKEQDMKAQFMRQFQQVDMSYWNKTISDLQIKGKIQSAEGAMYQRLLAYLSLAFYSISNQFISANRNKEAQYFVDLYKMADAGNSEAWYFSALLNARSGNAKAAESDLMKAAANGFIDVTRMMQQPEFQHLPINLTAIENKMKGNR